MPTRFASMRPALAVLTLAGLLVLLAAGLWISLRTPSQKLRPNLGNKEVPGDLELYQAIVDRMRHGQGYYDAAHIELRQRGYGTRSVFNWRPPLLAEFLAHVPPAIPRTILGLLAAADIAMAYALARRHHGVVLSMALALLLMTSLVPCLWPEAVFFGETWAGVLIAFSACAYGLNRWAIGCIAALLALFIRELTALYVMVLLVLALWERRRREVLILAIALACFAGYMAIHAQQVLGQLTAEDIAYKEGWLQFGGLKFLLTTMSMNLLLLNCPLWVTAVLFPLAVAGLASRREPAYLRIVLACAAFGAFFSVAGKVFNYYWGEMYTPLLACGVAWGPVAVYDLLRAARRPAAVPQQVA